MSKLRVVIVEDEAATARNLAHLLGEADTNISISTTLSSIKDSVTWLKNNPENYDLVFMDIRLADGLSFEIFKQVTIDRPVIFVTAYNDYAIQAFKNNGIDYILKPFDEHELKQGLDKYKRLAGNADTSTRQQLTALIEQFSLPIKAFKKSFLVHFRDKLIPVETLMFTWFYTANEIVYGHTNEGRQYVMEYTMEQLDSLLDPEWFFRANRQYIINRNAVTEVNFFFNGRLSVKIKPEPPERILVSKARVPEFKNWMNT